MKAKKSKTSATLTKKHIKKDMKEEKDIISDAREMQREDKKLLKKLGKKRKK